ncbi:Malonyl-CoA O-methyltransferase BioC [Luteitalea pratensis]|uniref:Malonyl-CoA O-methyltransferase BioC n=1 Tax=Luteitalea pratensis TaxID=1855912 RepID=A0A143PH17_LUTPR|nr:class I SAM-dependent methyltransferase [Luteitalea pratensis]AMY07054.1 Malonyl-CoA O-methyltransferase BioC [Luteitalea pratensis]
MSSTIQPHNLRAAAVWSRGGKAYDEISRGIADAIEHCVLRLDPQPIERVLDLSTGTGWTSRLVARRGATVVGADIAEDLLEAARARAIADGLDIEYRLADAERMPFGDGTFDAVVSTFGVMFAANPEAAASELARVVRPGGRMALSTWAPDGTVFGMFRVMRAYMPEPPSPAPPSPFAWGRPERVRELLGEAFDLRFESGTSFYREPSPQAAWHTFSTGYGPTRTLYENLDDERREGLRNDFIAFHAGFANDLGICVPREYCITIGTRR